MAQASRLFAAINVESIDFALVKERSSSSLLEGFVGWGAHCASSVPEKRLKVG